MICSSTIRSEIELQAIRATDKVAILGDGKMGLLVAQVVANYIDRPPLHIGRHQEKLDLVKGTEKLQLEAGQELPESLKQVFNAEP